MEDSIDNLGILQHPSKNACYSLMHPVVAPFSEVLIESWCMGVQSSYSTCNVAKYYSSEKADMQGKQNQLNHSHKPN